MTKLHYYKSSSKILVCILQCIVCFTYALLSVYVQTIFESQTQQKDTVRMSNQLNTLCNLIY